MANDPELVINAVRVSWLTLCGMMIFSRFVFQSAGPVFMREFLDTWKVSRTHRLWGGAALIYGIALLVLSLRVISSFSLGEHFLVWSLIFVLAADGLLNLVPSWFGNFKERMQEAWVSRRSKSMAPPDPGLFLWVNIALGLASFLVGAIVFLYRPLGIPWLFISLAAAVLLTIILIGMCKQEMRGTS